MPVGATLHIVSIARRMLSYARFTPMPLRTAFTATEREKIAVLVNNFCVYATQIISRSPPEYLTRARANLAMVKNDQEDLLKRLDELAREQNEESPMRLSEALQTSP